MTKPIAVLDVDGILLDIMPGMQKYMLDTHNFRVLEEHITDWDWEYCLGLPEGSTNEMWETVWSEPARVYPEAIEFVRTLKAAGYFVQGLSSRRVHSKNSKWNAVDAAHRDFPQLELDAYDLEHEKAVWIQTHMSDAEFMVEDNPENAVSIGTHTNLKVYLFTRPWNNRCISVTDAWHRVYQYDSILRDIHIRKYSKMIDKDDLVQTIQAI